MVPRTLWAVCWPGSLTICSQGAGLAVFESRRDAERWRYNAPNTGQIIVAYDLRRKKQ